MQKLSQHLGRTIALALIGTLFMPSWAIAQPKPVNPEAIHAKVLKRGVGNWIGVEEKNGIALAGRITSVDEQSFGLQLHNYPEITPIRYQDVAKLHTGISGTGTAILIGATVGGAVAIALVAHHEFEENKPQIPMLPATPPAPIFP